jgi:hypothetical protein
MSVIEMPGGLSDYTKIFEVSEFLENKDELIEQFKPEVVKLLVKKDFFKGPFRLSYNKAWDELICRLVKAELTKHFNYDPEELLLLSDVTFLKMLAPDLFNRESYIDSNKN